MSKKTFKVCSAGDTTIKTTSGYKSSFEAINDNIDNSLDAGASVINVIIDLDKEKKAKSITIADDGRGIEEDLEGSFILPGMTTKETGNNNDTGESTKGLYGSALPSSNLFLGSRTIITTSRRAQDVQSLEMDSTSIVAPGSTLQDDLEAHYLSQGSVPTSKVKGHYDTIRELYSLKGTSTNGVSDSRLSGTVVKTCLLHKADEISGDRMIDLKSNLSLTYYAFLQEDGVINPPAGSDRKPVKMFFTVTKDGKVQSSEQLKPYHVIPSKPKESYNSFARTLRYYNENYPCLKDSVIVKDSMGRKAQFDIDISVADDPQPGNDPVLRYSREVLGKGLGYFVGGRLLEIDRKQLSSLIKRSPHFPTGTTGMSRAGENLMICISADFSDSTAGKVRTRPFTADLLGIQAGKNGVHAQELLLDAIANCDAFKKMMKVIYDWNTIGGALPKTYQQFLKEWFDSKGEVVLKNISTVIFNDEKTLKIKGVRQGNTDLLAYDEKNATIEWDFDSFSHHVGLSRDLSGGNAQMNTIKICTLLFYQLNKASGNKFISPIDMAKAAGAELPKARKKLFEQDYVAKQL